MNHFTVRIQSKINKIRDGLDPVQFNADLWFVVYCNLSGVQYKAFELPNQIAQYVAWQYASEVAT